MCELAEITKAFLSVFFRGTSAVAEIHQGQTKVEKLPGGLEACYGSEQLFS